MSLWWIWWVSGRASWLRALDPPAARELIREQGRVTGAHRVAGHEDVPRLRAAVAHERADCLQQRPPQRVVRPVESAVDLPCRSQSFKITADGQTFA